MSITVRIKIRRAGGSLIATIPKSVVDSQRLRAGQEVQATFHRDRPPLEDIVGKFPELGAWDRSWTRRRGRF